MITVSSRASDISITESESYTPRHHYFTRLSAKYRNSPLENFNQGKTFANLSPGSEENQLVPKSKSVQEELDEEQLTKLLLDFGEFNSRNPQTFSIPEGSIWSILLMDWRESSGARNRNGFCFNKYSTYLILIAAVALLVIPFVINLRKNLNRMNDELRTLKEDVECVVQAKHQTEIKLGKIEKLLTEIKDGQAGCKNDLKDMMKTEMDKLNSDKTGRTDFALESAGGRIVQLSMGTENYGVQGNSLFGISLCEGIHGPRAMIQAGTSPGECWALKGSTGGAIIKLLGVVRIDGVSLEHISRKISPTGQVTTAPKDFAVWGLKDPADKGSLLAQFVYDIEGPLVQTFPLTSNSMAYEYVEFKVLSNHGHQDFTCVYRFRVHGVLEQFPDGKRN